MGTILDSILGINRPSPIGTLSSLATMPFNTPGYGSGMGADNLVSAPTGIAPSNGQLDPITVAPMGLGAGNGSGAGGFNAIPKIRLGPATGGLAPGNGWGDALTSADLAPGNNTPVPGGPVPPPSTDGKHPFFGAGGAGQTIAGILGDALLTATNHAPMYAPIMAQQRQEAMRARLQSTQQDAELKRQTALDDYKRAHEHQVVNMGNGGVAQWGGDGSFTVLREPDAPDPKQTQLQQNVDYLRKLNPTMTDAQAASIVQRGIQGYQYDPSYLAQRQDNTIAAIGARGNQARTTKGTPTGNATRPNGSGGGGGAASGVSTRDLLSTLGR